MKYFPLFYWILIAPQTQVHGQSMSIPDSARMHAIATHLDTVNREDLNLYPLPTLLNGNTIDDRLFFLAAHARVFDFLLRHGLDMGYVGKPLSVYSTNMPPEIMSTELRQEMAMMYKHHRQTNLFLGFLKIKEPYEYWIKTKFYTEDTSIPQLETDVATVVRYSGLAFPKTVQNILLLKYKHRTREKIEREILKRQ